MSHSGTLDFTESRQTNVHRWWQWQSRPLVPSVAVTQYRFKRRFAFRLPTVTKKKTLSPPNDLLEWIQVRVGWRKEPIAEAPNE